MATEDIIEAYCRIFNLAEITAFLKTALSNQASGVIITSLNFEGGSSSGVPDMGTAELIPILNACMDRLQPNAVAANPVSHWDFSSRALGT